jgi:MoaA/NifB/PqqE/SkfB family radical SAM enzyme
MAAIGPHFAEWLTTWQCNLRCTHCCAEAGARGKDELETAEASKLLADLGELGVTRLFLSGGEFAVRTDWQALLCAALTTFEAVGVITNGWLGAGMLETLSALPRREHLTLIVSLDGTRDAHNARRGTGSFERARSLLDAPASIAREALTTVARDNLADLPAVLDLLIAMKVTGWSVQPALPVGRMPGEQVLQSHEIAHLIEFLDDARQRAGCRLRISTPEWFRNLPWLQRSEPWGGCSARNDQIAILPNGEVTGCHMSSARVWGNVRSSSLREMWQAHAEESVRRCPADGCRVAGLLGAARGPSR